MQNQLVRPVRNILHYQDNKNKQPLNSKTAKENMKSSTSALVTTITKQEKSIPRYIREHTL